MDVIELIKKEGRRQGLSNKTIITYTFCVKKFMNYNKQEIKFIKKQDIKDYLDYLLDKGATGNTYAKYKIFKNTKKSSNIFNKRRNKIINQLNYKPKTSINDKSHVLCRFKGFRIIKS